MESYSQTPTKLKFPNSQRFMNLNVDKRIPEAKSVKLKNTLTLLIALLEAYPTAELADPVPYVIFITLEVYHAKNRTLILFLSLYSPSPVVLQPISPSPS